MKKNPLWLDSLGSPHWSITANCHTCWKYFSIITHKYLSARVYCIYLVTCCVRVFWNHDRLICLITCEGVTVATGVRLYVYVCVGTLEMCVCVWFVFTHSRSSRRLQCAGQSVLPRSSPAGRASGSASRFPAAARGELRSRSWSSQRRPVNTNTHGHTCTMKLNTSKPQACSQTSSFGTREQAHLFHSPHPALKVHAHKTYKVITGLQHI